MTTPQQPERVGDLIVPETVAAPCPRCGADSEGTRWTHGRLLIAKLCVRCAKADDATRENEELDRQREALAQRRREALTQLEVLPLYEGASMENFAVAGDTPEQRECQARAREFATRFVRDWPNGPVISVFAGGCGTGKGHLSWAIVRTLAETVGVKSRVAKLSDIIRDIREAWKSNEGPSEAARLARYRLTDLLVIDEVSRHALYGEPKQHLYDLIDWRGERLKPTILTSNESGDDLSALLGVAISSRVAGAGGFVNFGDFDFRIARQTRRQQP